MSKDNRTDLNVLKINGASEVVGTPTVTVLMEDALGNVLKASGATLPTDGDTGYATGCIFIDTDSGAGTTLYVNEGTASSANFNALESAESFVQKAQVTLTAAQVKALATTQITMVAAPGAGKVVEFLSASLKLNYGTNVFSESDDNLVFRYTNGSGVVVSDVVECTGFIDQSADTITSAVKVKDAIVAASASENKALVLDNNNANFAGNAADDNTLTVDVLYRVVTLA